MNDLDLVVRERRVGDDLVHADGVGRRRRRRTGLVADLLGRFHPLGGQELVLSATDAPLCQCHGMIDAFRARSVGFTLQPLRARTLAHPCRQCLTDRSSGGRRPLRLRAMSAARPGEPTGWPAGSATQVEARAAAHRHVGVHQLRHLPPPLPAAVRRHLQPRHRRDHHPGALLGLRQVPRPVPGRLHLSRPGLEARPRRLVAGTAHRRPLLTSRHRPTWYRSRRHGDGI